MSYSWCVNKYCCLFFNGTISDFESKCNKKIRYHHGVDRYILLSVMYNIIPNNCFNTNIICQFNGRFINLLLMHPILCQYDQIGAAASSTTATNDSLDFLYIKTGNQFRKIGICIFHRSSFYFFSRSNYWNT